MTSQAYPGMMTFVMDNIKTLVDAADGTIDEFECEVVVNWWMESVDVGKCWRNGAPAEFGGITEREQREVERLAFKRYEADMHADDEEYNLSKGERGECNE
mgnify:CR=1 FL=1